MDQIYQQISALCDTIRTKADDVDEGVLAQVVIGFTYSVLSHVSKRPVSMELRVSAEDNCQSGFIFGVKSLEDETLNDIVHFQNALRLLRSNCVDRSHKPLREFQNFIRKPGNLSFRSSGHHSLNAGMAVGGAIECDKSPVVVMEPLPKEFLHNYSKMPVQSVDINRSRVSGNMAQDPRLIGKAVALDSQSEEAACPPKLGPTQDQSGGATVVKRLEISVTKPCLQHRCPLCAFQVNGVHSGLEQLTQFLAHIARGHASFSREFASSCVDGGKVALVDRSSRSSGSGSMPVVTSSDIYTCMYCHVEDTEGRVFLKKVTLRRHIEESHMTRTTQGSQLTCLCCDKPFGTLGGDPKNAVYRMSIHMEEVHGLTLNIRPMPNLALTKRARPKAEDNSGLPNELLTVKPHYFPCVHCYVSDDANIDFAELLAFRRHMLTQHTTVNAGTHRLTCPLCRLTYESVSGQPRSLVTRMCEHWKKLHGDHPVVAKYARASEAESGTRSEAMTKPAASPKVFNCVICKEKGQQSLFWTKTTLRRHIQSDHMVITAKDQSIECPFCHRSLVSNTMKPRTLVFRICKHMNDIHAAPSQIIASPTEMIQVQGLEIQGFPEEGNDTVAEETGSSTFYCITCICTGPASDDIPRLHEPFSSSHELVEHIKQQHIIIKDSVSAINCAMCQKHFSLRSKMDIAKRYLKHLTTVHAFQYWNRDKAEDLAKTWSAMPNDASATAATPLKRGLKEMVESLNVSAQGEPCEHDDIRQLAVNKDDPLTEQTREEAQDGFADAVLVKLGLDDNPGEYRCHICNEEDALHGNITSVSEHVLRDHLLCNENSSALKCATCPWVGKHVVKRQLVVSFLRHCIYCHGWLTKATTTKVMSEQNNVVVEVESERDNIVQGLYENGNVPNSEQIIAISEGDSAEWLVRPPASFACFLCMDVMKVWSSWDGFIGHVRRNHVSEEGEDSVLTCPMCEFRIPRRASLFYPPGPPKLLVEMLLSHMVTKHSRPVPAFASVYRCSVCGWEDLVQSEYIQHMRTVHSLSVKPVVMVKGRGTACAFCGKPMKLNAVHSHIPYCAALTRKQDRALPYKCGQCSKFFSRQNVLDQHVRNIHQKEKNALCPLCGQAFFARRNLRVHAWEEHGELLSYAPNVLCTRCGETFPEFYMTRHQRRKHRDIDDPRQTGEAPKKMRQVKCKICEKLVAIRDSSSMGRHKARVHGINKFQCHICNAIMLSEDKLRLHQASSHASETTRHYCVLCRKQFMSRNNYHFHMFARHQVNLSRLPILTCGECGYRTIGKHFMSEHEATHMERSFPCPSCSKTFPTKARLNGHKSRSHGNHRYKCNLCPFTSLSRPSLHKHLNRTHLKKHFRCADCPYTSHVERYYRNHMSIHHGVSPAVANTVLTNLLQRDKNQLLKGAVTELSTDDLTGNETDDNTQANVTSSDVTSMFSCGKSESTGPMEFSVVFCSPGEQVAKLIMTSPSPNVTIPPAEVASSVLSIQEHESAAAAESSTQSAPEEIIQAVSMDESGAVVEYEDGEEMIIVETVIEDGTEIVGGEDQEIHYIYVDAEELTE